MSRVSAEARLHRLLALVPWVAARDGPTVEEVCTRFSCSERELADDLQLLFLCGLHPYTPDMLIEADVADGRVWIRYADYFSRPLRLTPGEGLALLAAGQTMLEHPSADPDGPLARGLHKLAATLGAGPDAGVDIALGPTAPDVLATLSEAVRQRRRTEIDYYSFGRDRWARRAVDPYAVFSAAGQWYLSAWCHSVDDERLFRVDRVREAVLLDGTFEAPARPPELTVFTPRPTDARITLELEPPGRWVAEQYPIEAHEELDGGRLRVRLAVSNRAWLERLLLRLGPAGRVVDGEDAAVEAACRLLSRYRRPPGEGWGHPPPAGPVEAGLR